MIKKNDFLFIILIYINMFLNKDNVISSFNKFFEENEKFTNKEFLEFTKKVVHENSIKKPLTPYQLFMKRQRVILNKRENEKLEGEEKKKSTELMKEIAEMWNIQKTRKEKKEEVK